MRRSRAASLWAAAGALAIIASTAYALAAGDFTAEMAVLVSLPWSLVTLLDIYVGLVLFSLWIVWRETSRAAAVMWVTALLLLGNLISCIYVFWSAVRSGGDMRRLLLGKQAPDSGPTPHRRM